MASVLSVGRKAKRTGFFGKSQFGLPCVWAVLLVGTLAHAEAINPSIPVSPPVSQTEAPAPSPTPAFPTALQDPMLYLRSLDPRMRVAGILGLSSRPAGFGHYYLRAALLFDADPSVRIAAVAALLKVGLAQYADDLAQAARMDPNPQVRAAAQNAYEVLWPLQKSPRFAAGLSLLCPGCGHFYLRKPGKASVLLGSTAVLVGSGLALALHGDVNSLALTDDSRTDAEVSRAVALPLLMGGQNLWFYSVFAAYRDARLMRGNHGYRYPHSKEDLGDLMAAPFHPRELSSPWFWAGLPAMLGAAVGVTYALGEPLGESAGRHVFDGKKLRFLGRDYGTGAGFALGELYYATLFFPVGMGEEALFRGVLQPGLTETFGPMTGWILTSLIFGAAHIGNFIGSSDASKGFIALPFITALGSYMGYVSMKNNYRLGTSVALHAWYDFLLSTIDFIADPENQPFAVRVAFPL